jgi:hypothetical protein
MDDQGEARSLSLGAGTLGFTYCGVPFVFSLAEASRIVVHFSDQASEELPSMRIPAWISSHLFARDGYVASVDVYVDARDLFEVA